MPVDFTAAENKKFELALRSAMLLDIVFKALQIAAKFGGQKAQEQAKVDVKLAILDIAHIDKVKNEGMNPVQIEAKHFKIVSNISQAVATSVGNVTKGEAAGKKAREAISNIINDFKPKKKTTTSPPQQPPRPPPTVPPRPVQPSRVRPKPGYAHVQFDYPPNESEKLANSGRQKKLKIN